ncbi:MAG: single-stranded DNA-binding protein [Streptosporangiaceae bacterium]|nr:single-stranded DNA-binding protein [Streptosporangiaceae bacterium]
MLPKIAEVGKLWKDPELRFTPGGKAVCTLSLVFTKKKKTEAGGWVDDKTFWLRATVWDQQAENCAETLVKGDQILISGELYQREYEQNGEKKQSLELQVYDVGPILKWNSAKINRAERESRTAPADDPWASVPPPPLDTVEEPPF